MAVAGVDADLVELGRRAPTRSSPPRPPARGDVQQGRTLRRRNAGSGGVGVHGQADACWTAPRNPPRATLVAVVPDGGSANGAAAWRMTSCHWRAFAASGAPGVDSALRAVSTGATWSRTRRAVSVSSTICWASRLASACLMLAMDASVASGRPTW